MARLSAGNADGAKEELGAVLAATEDKAEVVRKAGTRDGFTKAEVQPYIRAAHALGCLAYDEDRFADAVTELARVHSIDDGAVGIEARLISAKSLMKLEKAGEAAALLEPATKLKDGASRANVGLALAKFTTGDEAGAREALELALAANPHYGKTLLGRNPAAGGEHLGRAAGLGRGGAALRPDLRRPVDRRRQGVPDQDRRRTRRREAGRSDRRSAGGCPTVGQPSDSRPGDGRG